MKNVLIAIVVVGVVTALVIDRLGRKLVEETGADDEDDIYDVDKHSRGTFTGG